MRKNTLSMVERIKQRSITLLNGCVVFKGCLADGYGYIADVRGESAKRVHVVMWIHKYGPIPKQKPQLCVLHKCDNRACWNDTHLFLGTRRDNNIDMFNKGRADLSHPGEENPAAKISEVDVVVIRRSNEHRKILAVRYGLTPTMISYIRHRKAWRHVK